MTKPRLLIPITMQFSVRYLLRTGLLARISEYAQPVIALGWDDELLKDELEQCGFEVYRLPELTRGKRYEQVRGVLNLWHKSKLASPSTAIDERRHLAQVPLHDRIRLQVKKKAFEWQLRNESSESLFERERQLLHQDTNIQEFDALRIRMNVDAAFGLTPYLSDEEMMLRVCAIEQMPLCTSILSFDNITTRGWIPINFDSYLLWNAYNKNELLRSYEQVHPERVTIVGPAQFDFYWNKRFLWNEDEWCSRLQLPKSRPVILYGAGHHAIVPHEPHFVAQLDAAIEAGEIPEMPIILFRRHPNDPIERWKPLLNSSRHIVYDDPWPANGPVIGRTNVRDENIERLTSSLCYSDVQISVSSTMTIDGSIFDRPQIGPAYDDRPEGKLDQICYELYLREHYLPITNSGGLDLVRSRSAMINAVRDALNDPSRLAEGRKQLVREICTYTDGQCTSRVDSALRSFITNHQATFSNQLEQAAVV